MFSQGREASTRQSQLIPRHNPPGSSHQLMVPGCSQLSRQESSRKVVQHPVVPCITSTSCGVRSVTAQELNRREMRLPPEVWAPPTALGQTSQAVPQPASALSPPLVSSLGPQFPSALQEVRCESSQCLPTTLSPLPPDLEGTATSWVTLQEWNDPLDHDLEAQLIYRTSWV